MSFSPNSGLRAQSQQLEDQLRPSLRGVCVRLNPWPSLQDTSSGGQRFGVSGPHWKKSCLGPHIKQKRMSQKKRF